MGLLDWVVLTLVLLFAVRGLLRGTVWQVFSVCGLVVGLWTVGWVSQWVGEHWQGARPAAVFWALRWMVAVLAGLAAAALLQWWGGLLGAAVRAGPIGWLDRAGGLVLGGGLGALVVAFVLLAVVLAPWPRGLPAWVSGARVAPPLLRAGAWTCALSEPLIPGGRWLKERFLLAEVLARESRSI